MPNKVTALVPMRHSSERVARKNYRSFAGKPLFHYITRTLLDCPLISKVVIDTDSDIISNDLSVNFPSVKIIERPNNLIDGNIPMNDIIAHDISKIDSDFFLQTHSTNPLLKTDTITKAIQYFFENYPNCDSLFSVTKFQKRLWDSSMKPVNHNPSFLIRTQDLEPLYEENSCLYIFSKNSMQAHKNRIGEKPVMFETSKMESLDIDDETDFLITENIYKTLRLQNI